MTVNQSPQFMLLSTGHCPNCKDEEGYPVRLETQQELDSDHERSWYVGYWMCPSCDQWEEDLAKKYNLDYKMCHTCDGFGTTGYDEWEETCPKCDGIGYFITQK
jgi:Zn finger protein HypA/HybF involved in hydrogenase expression